MRNFQLMLRIIVISNFTGFTLGGTLAPRSAQKLPPLNLSAFFSPPSSSHCGRTSIFLQRNGANVTGRCPPIHSFAILSRGISTKETSSFFTKKGPFVAPKASKITTNARTTTAATPIKDIESNPHQNEQKKIKPTPIILLAGFLGSGKTTTLKHLLENKKSIKIGTIVNDVAAINIDSKLIANGNFKKSTNEISDGGSDSTGAGEMSHEAVIELQNGCACCSLADELFSSIVRLTQGGRRKLDAIVIELSGVADPVAVKDNWVQTKLSGHPATQLTELHRIVTVIDACTFGTDWMTWDTAGDRDSWVEGEDRAAFRNVPELLAEQVEAADLLIINKIDLAGKQQVEVASGVARGLNKDASVVEVEFGRVPLTDLLGTGFFSADEDALIGHEHGHSHEHSDVRNDKHDDHSHDHSHSHHHDHEAPHSDLDCPDTSHNHDHNHSSENMCTDPDCNDSSHSHSHDHKTKSSTAADQLGISTFVYKASIPFNSERLLALLNKWPVPIKDSLDISLIQSAQKEGAIMTGRPAHDNLEQSPFIGVLRSKGFCWMAPTKWTGSAGNDVWRHDTAMYWSHAGKHFGITTAGKWWGALTKDQMKLYFQNNMSEYDRIMREDWASEEWCDRRQELVFIGTNLNEETIRSALDECLCTEEEIEIYRAQCRNYLDTKLNSLGNGGPSLFSVGGVDHLVE